MALPMDLIEVVRVARMSPDKVMVRDIYNDHIFPLTDIAKGPFYFVPSECVMTGNDIEGKAMKLRIVNEGVVELCDEGSFEWRRPSLGSVRIYTPK